MKKIIKLLVLIGFIVFCISIGGYCIIKYYTAYPGLEKVDDELLANSKYMEIIDDIYQDRPILKFDFISEIDRLNIIRDWVYDNSTFANDAGSYIETFDNRINADNIPDYLYNVFNLETLYGKGMYCGGISATLSILYNSLGYTSYTVDYAVFNDKNEVVSSHVLTVVYVQKKWIVEDATFNVTYENSNGKPLDINEIIISLKNNKYEQVKPVRGISRYRSYLSSKRLDKNSMFPFLLFNINKINDVYHYESYMSLKKYEPIFEEMYPYFKADGYKTEKLSLFLYPYEVYKMPLIKYEEGLYEQLKNKLQL